MLLIQNENISYDTMVTCSSHNVS